MTLSEIKDKLDIQVLELNTANDADENPTNWMRHWDNDNRVAVSIHKDTIAAIQESPSSSNLGLQHETRTGEKGDYDAYRIVMYKPAEIRM